MSTEQDIVTEEPQVAEKTTEAGTLLKERRIELGLTQKQIADRLRLRLSIIEGIEENHFESGQVATFTRGYLRSYAKAVNMDEQVVLDALADCGDAQPQEQPMMSFSRQTKRERNDSRIMMLTWGILAIIIAISSLWWWQNQLQDTLVVSNSDDVEIEEPVTDINQPTPVDTIESAEVITPMAPPQESTALEQGPIESTDISLEDDSASTSGQQTEANIMSNDEIKTLSSDNVSIPSSEVIDSAVTPVSNNLEAEPVASLESELLKPLAMTFSADCWIQVKDASGKILSTGIKKAGQTIELGAESPVNIILGAPESVSMTFASEPVDLSGYTSGKVARFTLP
ncbi:cytoskeleton protein RodZ [Vibrio genomosp. F10]|uniref:cytoskeleton protein RodZ n=1 Tax=Vibrio genomosp. F10 TaxID=723171 RepID=UPI0003156B0C|nr:cytoskeleton protein RodZ [Vibrio genomosp. F10]OEF04872.1 transcriptional regulator [Vibrio genomosp. F10 str. 9ZB36]OEF05734.1 transcriptional regulator [Vibrio genomosp. F10 str. 9ZD137]